MRQTNGESGLRPLAVCEPILRHVPETSRMHPLLAARGSRASSDHHCAEARGTVHPVGVGRRNAGSTACELIGVTTGRRVHRPDQRRRPTGCHGIPATTSQPTCSAVVTALLPAQCGLMGAGTSHPASAIAAAHAAASRRWPSSEGCRRSTCRVDDLVERCDPGTQRAPQRTGQPQDPTVVVEAHGHDQTSRCGQAVSSR